MADYRQHYGGTSAPLAVKDLVLSGTSGGDEGARGFVDAYRAGTGEHAWRFWTMPIPAPGEEGDRKTWIGRAIEHGCGRYRLADRNHYASRDGPHLLADGQSLSGLQREIFRACKGDNLYTSSVVALEPKTGKLRWYYQFTPHDLHDWDAAQTPMLVDAEFHGRARKLLLQGNRNGFFYVLDRVTGQFLLGEPFVHKMTWASGIGADGRPKVLPGSEPSIEGTKTCPDVAGAANWMSVAYNAATGVLLCSGQGILRHLHEIVGMVGAGAILLWRRRATCSRRGHGAVRARNRHSNRQNRLGDSADFEQSAGRWLGLVCSRPMAACCSIAMTAERSRPPMRGAERSSGNFHTNQGWHASPMTHITQGKQYVAVAAGSNILAFALP